MMFKYLLFVQVLLAKELYSWEHPFIEEHLEHSFKTFSNLSGYNRNNFTQSYFPQKLNHFGPNDSRRWLQRYFVSEDYYRPGGPIFLMYAVAGYEAMLEYGKQFGALCVILVKRYTLGSLPTNDVSSENLKYLNSPQELADIANFISNKNSWLRKDTNKLVVFGLEHAGSIAAWSRLKYPHLVDGAVASSARFEHGLAYSGYYRLAAEALGNYSTECANGVKDAFKELNIQLDHQDGQKQIKEQFKLCPTRHEPEFSPDDIPFLNDVLTRTVAFYALYRNTSHACTTITNQTIAKPLDRLASYIRILLHQVGQDCIRYKYVDFIMALSNLDWVYNFGGRQHLYQTCTELGNFPINDHSHVFGHRISFSYHSKLCTDLFGSAYNVEALDTTIAMRKVDYGGKNIDVTNVVFVQGSKDPFLSLGVVKDVNSKSPAIVIKGEYQYADMWPSKETDSAELKEARKKIASNIETWLKY